MLFREMISALSEQTWRRARERLNTASQNILLRLKGGGGGFKERLTG